MGRTKKANAEAAVSTAETPTRARLSHIAIVLGRIGTIQSWIGRGISAPECARRAQWPLTEGGLGLSRASAFRYVGEATRHLARDDDDEPIESKRARIIAILHANIERAAATDFKAVNQGAGLLADIWGVRTPKK